MTSSIKKLIKLKLDRLESVPDKFEAKIPDINDDIFAEVVSLLDKLNTKNGKITSTKGNLKTASGIISRLSKILKDNGYNDVVKSFLKEFDTQVTITNGYLSKELAATPSAFAKEFIKQEKASIALALAGSSAIDVRFKEPVKDVIFKAISGNGTVKDLIKELKLTITGNKNRLGILDRYVKQIASDAFAQTDRVYTKTVADSAGAVFYLYQGGLVQDSRSFCKERDSKYYHLNEVTAWGSESAWQGQISGTNSSNIFTNLGGYNCKHGIVAVSVFSVPKDVILRNIGSGNFEPTEKQRELLGLE